MFWIPESECLRYAWLPCEQVWHKCGKVFCDKKCASHYNDEKVHGHQRIKIICAQCGIEKTIPLNRTTRGCKNIFCSSTCNGNFYREDKFKQAKGYNRSKLEAWIGVKLTELYPNLEILFNSKKEIDCGLELDIYIPELKFGAELNGIFHYFPIHGAERFDKAQRNDQKKLLACIEKGIAFLCIDTTSQKRFTEKSSVKFLEIIVEHIELLRTQSKESSPEQPFSVNIKP